MPLQFDATLKGLIKSSPQAFLATFDRPPGGSVSLLNVDLSSITTSADLVFGLGEPLEEVVHVDVQSGPSAAKHRDLLVYNGLLHRQYEVPVHSILLLLRPQAAHSNLTGTLSYTARPGRGRMDFGYEVVRLWEVPAESLLTGDLFLVPLTPLGQLVSNVPVEDGLAVVVQRAVERLLGEAPEGVGRDLLTAMYTLTGLRLPRHRVRNLFRGVQAMHDSDTYQEILDEGAVAQARKMILRQGTLRFGPPPEHVAVAIRAMDDLDRLDSLGQSVLTASSWDDLLAS